MELKFRPKFNRDLLHLKGKLGINHNIEIIIRQIKSAKDISKIPGYKTLDKYETRCRIKIKINHREDYRMGLIIKGHTIWIERILLRPDFYKFYRR